MVARVFLMVFRTFSGCSGWLLVVFILFYVKKSLHLISGASFNVHQTFLSPDEYVSSINYINQGIIYVCNTNFRVSYLFHRVIKILNNTKYK